MSTRPLLLHGNVAVAGPDSADFQAAGGGLFLGPGARIIEIENVSEGEHHGSGNFGQTRSGKKILHDKK